MQAPPRFYCPHCLREAVPDSPDARLGWAFCTLCGTSLDALPASVANVRSVASPEAVRFSGFRIRFLGHLIDYVVNIAVAELLLVVFVLLTGPASSRNELVYLSWAFGAAVFLMYSVVGSALGVTLGKLIVGIRLVNDNGNPPGWGSALIRTAASIVSGMVLSLGYWRMLWHSEKQTLHDDAANTYVVPVADAGRDISL